LKCPAETLKEINGLVTVSGDGLMHEIINGKKEEENNLIVITKAFTAVQIGKSSVRSPLGSSQVEHPML